MIKVALESGGVEFFDGNIVSTGMNNGSLIIIKGDKPVAEVAVNKWIWYKVEGTNA